MTLSLRCEVHEGKTRKRKFRLYTLGNDVSERTWQKTDRMFSAQHFIAKITQYMTLHPGDVIWLGTDGATEPDLKDGDVVEIEQKEIGILRSPVVQG